MSVHVESVGHGRPLVLLHGGGSTIDVTWGRILPFLARDRRVIAVEEQAHGRTSDRNAPARGEETFWMCCVACETCPSATTVAAR